MSDLSPAGRLAEIEARANAAHPGPWEYEQDQKRLEHLVTAYAMNPIRFGYLGNRSENEAVFVAHAREDVPWLIAEVKRLQAELDETRRRASDLCSRPDGVCLEKVWDD